LESKEFKEEIEQGLVQPRYTISEVQKFEISDTFYSHDNIIKFKRPSHLNIEIYLPRVNKISEINLEINTKKLILDVDQMY